MFSVQHISSMEKIQKNKCMEYRQADKRVALAGESFAYQIYVKAASPVVRAVTVRAAVTSPFGENVKLYEVKDAYLDTPYTDGDLSDEDYLVHEPCFMPDVLVPLEEQGNLCSFCDGSTFWVKVNVPADMPAGDYEVNVSFTQITGVEEGKEPFVISAKMPVRVLAVAKEPQKLIYTRWFYADCIAVQHNVEIYSEAHWELIDKYIQAAASVGINMILVPVHTPPLDTAVGTRRPCVQLVDIKKNGDNYTFSFDKFKRFIEICKKNGIKYFEIAHMFSQWGAKCAPNIMVTENGKKDYLFGWHVAAHSEEYVNFLKQYINAISKALEAEGISENTYFHISDEPNLQNMDTYKTASEIIRPLIGKSKTFDALSHYEIYDKGLVECPVTSVSHIHTFLEHDIPNQWAYYCCNPQRGFLNNFMAMPSYRVRMLGFLLYKYNIKGFLHWGFNFYNSQISYHTINPYLTTSAGGAFPSGDPFIVYPSRDGAYSSIRGEVTYDAIQDMDVCLTLERYIGRDAVVKMIDQAAGMELRFDQYPKGNAFVEDLREMMVRMIGECV